MTDLSEFAEARLAEWEETARAASGGTVIGVPGDWKPAPGGDEWEVGADLYETDFGRDGDLEILVALRPGLPRPPEVKHGYWGSVVSWNRDLADRDAWVPEPQFRHMALHDPASALILVTVLRAVLDDHRHAGGDSIWCRRCDPATPDMDDAAAWYPCRTTRLVVSIWRNHPAYDQTWKP